MKFNHCLAFFLFNILPPLGLGNEDVLQLAETSLRSVRKNLYLQNKLVPLLSQNTSREKEYQKALELYQKRFYEESAELFSDFVQNEKHEGTLKKEGFLILGHSLLEMKKWNQARVAYEEYIRRSLDEKNFDDLLLLFEKLNALDLPNKQNFRLEEMLNRSFETPYEKIFFLKGLEFLLLSHQMDTAWVLSKKISHFSFVKEDVPYLLRTLKLFSVTKYRETAQELSDFLLKTQLLSKEEADEVYFVQANLFWDSGQYLKSLDIQKEHFNTDQAQVVYLEKLLLTYIKLKDYASASKVSDWLFSKNLKNDSAKLNFLAHFILKFLTGDQNQVKNEIDQFLISLKSIEASVENFLVIERPTYLDFEKIASDLKDYDTDSEIAKTNQIIHDFDQKMRLLESLDFQMKKNFLNTKVNFAFQNKISRERELLKIRNAIQDVLWIFQGVYGSLDQSQDLPAEVTQSTRDALNLITEKSQQHFHLQTVHADNWKFFFEGFNLIEKNTAYELKTNELKNTLLFSKVPPNFVEPFKSEIYETTEEYRFQVLTRIEDLKCLLLECGSKGPHQDIRLYLSFFQEIIQNMHQIKIHSEIKREYFDKLITELSLLAVDLSHNLDEITRTQNQDFKQNEDMQSKAQQDLAVILTNTSKEEFVRNKLYRQLIQYIRYDILSKIKFSIYSLESLKDNISITNISDLENEKKHLISLLDRQVLEQR